MAVGAFPDRPGGFPVKTTPQSFGTQRSRQLQRNLVLPLNVYTADGAIAPDSGIAVISKTSAAAMTLAAPVAGTDDGLIVRVVAGTLFAHAVTATGLLDTGTTGGPHNVLTTAAFIGSGFELMAYNGHWVLLSNIASAIT